jgi:monoterpene epsilon-lactone hydrolase
MTGPVTGRRARRRGSGLRMQPALGRLVARQLGRYVVDPHLPWETQRRRMEAFMRTLLVPRGTSITSTVLKGVRTEVVTAAGVAPEHTVVHFHGGGYCVGSPLMARAWAAHLSAQAQCRVLVPDYRLAPEHAHPAALADARDVVAAVLGETTPRSVVLSGDSAGGGLVLALVLALRDAGLQLPAGLILLSPWLDLSADRWAVPELVRRDVLLSPPWLAACADAYAGGGLTDPAVSPLLAGHAGLPPLLIQAASDDLLAPDAQRLAASASAAGVDISYTKWQRAGHDFMLQAGTLAAADSALAQAAWFVTSVTGG